MFCNYSDNQKLAYNLLSNEIKQGVISHAYLINENNNANALEFVLSFVKSIFCEGIADEKLKGNICKKIDDGSYQELKIIKPDGLNIKKQQIIDLQKEFSRKVIDGKYRIYIICECDKMKLEAANSMLKFLEEPSENIIAILMTNNYNNVLSTIISRCQIIKLENSFSLVENLSNCQYKQQIIDFVVFFEQNKMRLFLDKDNIFFNKDIINNRSLFAECYGYLIDIYYKALLFFCGINNFDCTEYEHVNKVISENNSLLSLIKKIDFLVRTKEQIKYNLNLSLFVDKFIIEMVKL